METKDVKKIEYTKPETKKHEASNIVQGSSLYSSYGSGSTYTYTYYRVVLYYSS